MVSEQLRNAAKAAMEGARMKGIAVGVARDGGPPEMLYMGTDAAGRALGEDSLFAVASVTKLATALAVHRLADGGELSYEDPLSSHLPEAVAAAHHGVTLRRMLSHTSGLPLDVPGHMAPYEPGLDWPALASACLQTPLERAPEVRVQYSNVGYGLLALVVERRTGRPFPDALEELVLRPLGIEGYLGTEPTRPVTARSGARGSHKGTDMEPFNSPFWRSLAMPWAGLVTTAEGALKLVEAFRGNPSSFLKAETAAEATRNQAGDLPGGFVRPLIWPRSPWGMGPEIRDEKSPHWAPPEASPDSFGHSGASGCVAWADRKRKVSWVVVGTRTADSGWLLRQGKAVGSAVLAGG